MAYTSFKDFCVAAQLAKPDQFDQWQSDWRAERADLALLKAKKAEGKPLSEEENERLKKKDESESLPQFIRKQRAKKDWERKQAEEAAGESLSEEKKLEFQKKRQVKYEDDFLSRVAEAYNWKRMDAR